MVAELPRTVEDYPELAGRRVRKAVSRTRRLRRPPWMTGLVLTLAALGVVVAVSLGLAAAKNPSDDVRRLTLPDAAVHQV